MGDDVDASVTSRQSPACFPRATRPRSWCSWLTPNRSASMTTMTVALGTSTPTSTTVVATRTSISPAGERLHAGVLLLRGEPAVQDVEAQPGQRAVAQQLGDVEDGERRAAVAARAVVGGAVDVLGLVVGAGVVTDPRADDVGLPAGGDLLAQPLPGAVEPGRLLRHGTTELATPPRPLGSWRSVEISRSP